MTLVKLKNGNALNTDVIAFIDAGKAWLKQPVITRQDSLCTSRLLFVAVTEDDIERLLEAGNVTNRKESAND